MSKSNDDHLESLVVSIWPGLKCLGARSKSAAYMMAKRLPPEALVEIGQMTRISKAWLDRATSGERAPLTGDALAKLVEAAARSRGVTPGEAVRQILDAAQPRKIRKARELVEDDAA
jgi:hypothetical protein